MSKIYVDEITGFEGTETGAPITLSGDTATLGSAVTFPTGHVVKYEHSSTTPSVQYSINSYIDVTGTSFTYTPATGASKVFYQTRFVISRASTSESVIAHFKLVHDGSTVDGTRQTIAQPGSSTDFITQIVITHTFSAWSDSKVTKVQYRQASGSYSSKLHVSEWWDGSSSGNQILDVHTFMYSIM